MTNEFFEQVEGRLPNLIAQSPHALVVAHVSALFVPFAAVPGNDPAAAFCKRFRCELKADIACHWRELWAV